MTSFYRDDLAALPEMELAAQRVYEMGGLSAKDIDAACLYDAFTPEILMQLEAFGFCGKGEAKDFVTEDSLTIGGALPNNTHGGLLSEAYMHGVNNLAEGVRLVRGELQPTRRRRARAGHERRRRSDGRRHLRSGLAEFRGVVLEGADLRLAVAEEDLAAAPRGSACRA